MIFWKSFLSFLSFFMHEAELRSWGSPENELPHQLLSSSTLTSLSIRLDTHKSHVPSQPGGNLAKHCPREGRRLARLKLSHALAIGGIWGHGACMMRDDLTETCIMTVLFASICQRAIHVSHSMQCLASEVGHALARTPPDP